MYIYIYYFYLFIVSDDKVQQTFFLHFLKFLDMYCQLSLGMFMTTSFFWWYPYFLSFGKDPTLYIYIYIYDIPLEKVWTPLSSSYGLNSITAILLKDGFGIKLLMKVDLPLNKETKPFLPTYFLFTFFFMPLPLFLSSSISFFIFPVLKIFQNNKCSPMFSNHQYKWCKHLKPIDIQKCQFIYK